MSVGAAGEVNLDHLANKSLAQILHCKLTIFPFVIPKYLQGIHQDYINILCLIKVSLANFSVCKSCLRQWSLRCFSDFLFLSFYLYLLTGIFLKSCFSPIYLFIYICMDCGLKNYLGNNSILSLFLLLRLSQLWPFPSGWQFFQVGFYDVSFQYISIFFLFLFLSISLFFDATGC